MQTFIKTVNYNHMMPTRYTLDLDLKNVGPDVLENTTKKVEARKVGVETQAQASGIYTGMHAGRHTALWLRRVNRQTGSGGGSAERRRGGCRDSACRKHAKQHT